MVCSIYFPNRTTYVPGTVRAILSLPVVWGHMVLLQSCVDCLQHVLLTPTKIQEWHMRTVQYVIVNNNLIPVSQKIANSRIPESAKYVPELGN